MERLNKWKLSKEIQKENSRETNRSLSFDSNHDSNQNLKIEINSEDEFKKTEEEEDADEIEEIFEEVFYQQTQADFYPLSDAPNTIKTELYDYQKQFLTWALERENPKSKFPCAGLVGNHYPLYLFTPPISLIPISPVSISPLFSLFLLISISPISTPVNGFFCYSFNLLL